MSSKASSQSASNKLAAMNAVIWDQITADPNLPRENSTESLWQSPRHPEVGSVQSAVLPEQVDHIVIGSGIAGLGAVRTLLESPAAGQQTVTLLEARNLCSGATGRNGGQLTRVPPTLYPMLSESFGAEQAKKIFKYTVDGLEEMKHLATDHGAETEAYSRYQPLEKFFAYYDEQSWRETVEGVEHYEKENPEDKGIYKLVTKEECDSIYMIKGAHGGLRFPAGVISPHNLVSATFARFLKNYPSRLTIETRTPATAIEYHPSSNSTHPYIVKTPRGNIRATNILHCTNGWSGHLLPGLRGKMYPRRGTMSVQNPGKSFPDMSRKQSWSLYFTPKLDEATDVVETGRYYCFQNRDTGDLWVGGDRDSLRGFIGADDTQIDPTAEKNLRAMLPNLWQDNWIKSNGDVRGIWTGVMCYTGDRLPFIGKLPGTATGRRGSGEWIAGGWNSYGMTNGLRSGSALAKLVLGEEVPYLPESYYITPERMSSSKLKVAEVVRDFFERTGAHKYIKGSSVEAKL
ncbi:FAD dependent oxidoreductase domain-containing protein [Sarocladium implicatum]|nr:FAD dependent oxidoreductase domain-containing protein [Sarocladium implicatum]